ncbi:hypothetical protein [Chloracidobacterium thermophilum]|uniref:hypothetical protein n=1 Tax=Chloracidobacterium thermophilum TaxID=458033 RepID=UPI0011D25649|nr:hypothetical protein [Chloracidobacterium thermophilum]QUV78888.1 hypothetical protein J8C08_00955 [Chloracidobacterium thermophilum]
MSWRRGHPARMMSWERGHPARMNPTGGFNRRYATGGGLGAYVIRGLKPTAKFNRRYATSLGGRASCPQDEM